MSYDIAVLMGSTSDLPNLEKCFTTLKEFEINFTVRVISAHRTPDVAAEFAKNAEESGIKIIICAAGMAAHLAGVIASHTILPVIGIPMISDGFNALDSLLSTVQMPPGIPVAAVSAGKAGAKNAALYAIQILALSNKNLNKKIHEFRQKQTDEIIKSDKNLTIQA